MAPKAVQAVCELCFSMPSLHLFEKTVHLSFFLSFLSLGSPPAAFDSLDFSSSFSFCFSALAASCAMQNLPSIKNAESTRCTTSYNKIIAASLLHNDPRHLLGRVHGRFRSFSSSLLFGGLGRCGGTAHEPDRIKATRQQTL
jgi:hypothetical protein